MVFLLHYMLACFWPYVLVIIPFFAPLACFICSITTLFWSVLHTFYHKTWESPCWMVVEFLIEKKRYGLKQSGTLIFHAFFSHFLLSVKFDQFCFPLREMWKILRLGGSFIYSRGSPKIVRIRAVRKVSLLVIQPLIQRI